MLFFPVFVVFFLSVFVVFMHFFIVYRETGLGKPRYISRSRKALTHISVLTSLETYISVSKGLEIYLSRELLNRNISATFIYVLIYPLQAIHKIINNKKNGSAPYKNCIKNNYRIRRRN